MIKEILLKCSHLLNRDDIYSSIKKYNSVDEIENQSLQIDVIKLISYFNFVNCNLFENYLTISHAETLHSDENNRIYFSAFSKRAVKILSVKTTSNQNTLYSIQSTFLSTNAPNSDFIIEYNYTPRDVKDFSDSFEIPFNLNTKILCYGIVSEFLASKDQFEKSEFWKNKFLYEIFKLKTKKERRLKSIF